MRTNMPRPPTRSRPTGRLTRLLSATALATALAVAVTGNQLPPVAQDLARTDLAADTEVPAFDPDAQARMREEQCLLDFALRKGGQELKAVARAGLNGTEADLHKNADSAYWYNGETPLALAFAKDTAWVEAKIDEVSARPDVWEQSLAVETTPGGYTVVGFEWVEDKDDPFDASGLGVWLGKELWNDEFDLYDTDQTPLAGDASVASVNAIAAVRYPDVFPWPDYEGWRAFEDMTFMHPMYADDARLFLQHGGFPETAPDPDSMEFRVDVEALKSRFASCTTGNPLDPRGVLGEEIRVASTEWQAELASQRTQRDAIMIAESQASRQLTIGSQAMGEALGQSIIASRLTDWQAYWLKQPTSDTDYPTAAEFATVKTRIESAQARAQGRVFVASRAALAAKNEAAKAESAKQAAYTTADAAGQPRGRGLMYGQQAVQVAKASAAAALAVSKATETAANATRASAADSKTLMALAQTQAHASAAEFRRIAAQEAAAQAKAAADGAALQATKAAENATKAKAAQAKAEAAEKTAKAAAADAKAKRLTAETERDNAETQKNIAASERAKAASAENRAQAERATAATALSAAQTAGTTAATKKDEALAAERRAVTARNNAIQAESDRDAALSRMYAYDAKAEADDGTEAAEASRAAATQARTAANNATTAASNARAAANDATTAAANAREAATKAQAAATRAKAASDAAQRDVAITHAAVTKAHAAAADAIDASDAAAQNVRAAKALADTAKAKAAEAKANATLSRLEANSAAASAVQTAGFAYATAQAALAARDSAAQVIKPANDAIELGSPYKETDSSAGLAVLAGQGAKTAAQQQAALAQAKAAQAAKASTEAAALAAKADADAKVAATAAAEAADSAAKAMASVAQAQVSAAEASTAAKAAVKAEANTVEYDRQATADAAAALTASNTASGYATEAAASADAAEQDAASARNAATAAEGDAATARGIADQAEADATEAEASAARAQEAAKEAEDAATRAEETEARSTVDSGGATGVGKLFTKQKLKQTGDPVPQNDCVLDIGFGGCTVKYKLTFDVTVDFYLCQDEDLEGEVTAATCPADAVLWLGNEVHENQTAYIDKYFSRLEITMIFDKMVLQTLWVILTDDFVQCAKGSVSGCLWAASNFIPGKKIADAIDAVRALDAAMHTGIGVTDAFRALKTLDLDPAVLANIERQVNVLEDAFTACRVNSFPAGTQVLMADGSHRGIEDVRQGDLLMASDPLGGDPRAEAVTDTFRHGTDRLVEISLDGGSTLSSTAGHKVYTAEAGWTLVADLRTGDRLRGPDGSLHAVTSVLDRSGLDPRTVYDLTVDSLHTFYVSAQGARPQDVLVHNCMNLKLHEGADGGHTYLDHIDADAARAKANAQANYNKNPSGPGTSSVWNDEATAVASVETAFQQWLMRPKGVNQKKLANWMKKTSPTSNSALDLFPAIRIKIDDVASFGKAYDRFGNWERTGGSVVIVLKRSSHKPGYMVYTAYPE